MVARLSTIAVGIVIAVIFWSVLSVLMPSSSSFTNTELEASFVKRFLHSYFFECLAVLTYAVAAAVGGAASTFVRRGHSLKTAAAIGSFYPAILVLGTAGTHLPVPAGWALILAIAGTFAAFLGQKFLSSAWIRARLTLENSDGQASAPREVADSRSALRVVAAVPSGFFATVFALRLLLTLFVYDTFSGPFVVPCFAMLLATAVGMTAFKFISGRRTGAFALPVGIAVPAFICLLTIASVLGFDVPFGFAPPLDQIVYRAFPVYELHLLPLYQDGMLALFGVLGAFASSRTIRGWHENSLRRIPRALSVCNAVGAAVLVAGLMTSSQSFLITIGVLVGLLGSFPTLILARRGSDQTAFNIAGVSLVASFLSIFLPVVAGIFRPERGSSNESAAVANLRTINTAEVTYLSSYGGTYGQLKDLIDVGLLDSTFLDESKAGYRFDIKVSTGDYVAVATPHTSRTGKYGYYSVADAVVRYSLDAALAPRNQQGSPVQ